MTLDAKILNDSLNSFSPGSILPDEKALYGVLEIAAKLISCPRALLYIDDRINRFQLTYGKILHEESEVVFAAKSTDSNAETLLVHKEHIVFGVGFPLQFPGGQTGSLCLFDSQAKSITSEEINVLKLLSAQIVLILTLKWQNDALKKDAQKQFKNQMKVIRKARVLQEKEKEEIANKLHEHLAQELASDKLYLQVAEESEQMRLPLIRKVNESLGKLIQEICELSDAIAPHSVAKMPLEELVEGFIAEINTEKQIRFSFSINGDIGYACYKIRMILFKIIEKWVKMLALKPDITVIDIRLSLYENTVLEIEDNGSHLNTPEIANAASTIKLEHILEMMGGTGKLTHLSPAGNLLSIEL